MNEFSYFMVDAFAEQSFKGNQAGVVLLKNTISENLMQSIASENQLSETAFVSFDSEKPLIRWFTPESEVDLCGHATLAAAHILFDKHPKAADKIVFSSLKKGDLVVRKTDKGIELDFPQDKMNMIPIPELLEEAVDIPIRECYQGTTDIMCVLANEKQIQELTPDIAKLNRLNARGIIFTAPGEKVDFVSRFFAPKVGITEDAVTGSAHTSLTPYWAKRLSKNKFTAQQLSSRGGSLLCELEGDRVKITGRAATYLKGIIEIKE